MKGQNVQELVVRSQKMFYGSSCLRSLGTIDRLTFVCGLLAKDLLLGCDQSSLEKKIPWKSKLNYETLEFV